MGDTRVRQTTRRPWLKLKTSKSCKTRKLDWKMTLNEPSTSSPHQLLPKTCSPLLLTTKRKILSMVEEEPTTTPQSHPQVVVLYSKRSFRCSDILGGVNC